MKQKIFTSIMAVLIILTFSDICHISASDYSRYMYSYTENDILNIFVRLNDQADIEECTLGGLAAQITGSGIISENIPVNTVILIDAYAVESKPDGHSILLSALSDILSNSVKNEQYSLLVFSDGVLDTAESCTTNQLNMLDSANTLELSADYASDICDCIKMTETYMNGHKCSGLNRIVLVTDSSSIKQLSSIEDPMIYPLYIISDDKISFDTGQINKQSFTEIFQYDDDASKSGYSLNKTDNIYLINVKIPSDLGPGKKKLSTVFSGEDKKIYIEAQVDLEQSSKQSEKTDMNRKTVFAAVILSVIAVVSSAVIIFRHIRSKHHNHTITHTAGLPNIPQELFGRILSSRTTQAVKRQDVPSVILSHEKYGDVKIELMRGREYILGRSSTLSDIKIDFDKSISQKHCRIYLKNNDVYVTDLGSLNHTYVDGVKVKTELRLTNNCRLRLGRADFTVSIK